MTVKDEFLKRALELAAQARSHGNHPFGAHLVIEDQIVLTAENSVITDRNPTSHAETNLVQKAIATLGREALARSTLYTSCEPCAMCTGAIYWAGIRRIVYALSSEELAKVAGRSGLAACREVLKGAAHEMEVAGPFMLEKALEVHEGYWS